MQLRHWPLTNVSVSDLEKIRSFTEDPGLVEEEHKSITTSAEVRSVALSVVVPSRAKSALYYYPTLTARLGATMGFYP